MIDANKTIEAIRHKLDGMTDEEKIDYLQKMGFTFKKKEKSDTIPVEIVGYVTAKPYHTRLPIRHQSAAKGARVRNNHNAYSIARKGKTMVKKKG